MSEGGSLGIYDMDVISVMLMIEISSDAMHTGTVLPFKA